MTGLRGRIRTAAGWAVEHAVLTVTDLTGQQVARVETDEKGAVATQSLPPGFYTAVITSAAHDPVAKTVQIAPDGSGSLGEVLLARTADAIELPPTGVWTIDPVHTSVVGTARHLGIASVKARFPDVSGRIVIGLPAERSSVQAELKAASIETGIKMRDDHLKSADFLDVEVHPIISFASSGLRQRGKDTWTLTGDLVLHGQTRAIELELSYGGCTEDAFGFLRAAFHAETHLHRNDFAINYNAMVRAGVVAVVGADIKIELDIEAVQGETLPSL